MKKTKKPKLKKISVMDGAWKGGYEFNIIKTPCSQLYTVDSIHEVNLESESYYNGYMPVSDIKAKKFPLDVSVFTEHSVYSSLRLLVISYSLFNL